MQKMNDNKTIVLCCRFGRSVDTLSKTSFDHESGNGGWIDCLIFFVIFKTHDLRS